MLVDQLIRHLGFGHSFVIGYFVIRSFELTLSTWATIGVGATAFPLVGTRTRHRVAAPIGLEQQLGLALQFPGPVRRALAGHLPRA